MKLYRRILPLLGMVMFLCLCAALTPLLAMQTPSAPLPTYTVSARLKEPGEGMRKFRFAFDVALDSQKNIYVVAESRDGTVLMDFGKLGAYNGAFLSVAGIAIDAQGNLLMTDFGSDKVNMYSPQGEFIAAIGGHGDGDDQFNSPIGIVIDNLGYFYVADQMNDRVQKYDREGHLVLSIKHAGASPWHPRWLALDGRGYLYVMDYLKPGIDKFTTDGRFVRSMVKPGKTWDTLVAPEGIGVDARGILYVADGGGIKRFDQKGRFLEFYQGDAPEGEISQAKGIWVEPDGTIYITCHPIYCVMILKPKHH